MNVQSMPLRFTTLFFLECDGGYVQIDTGYCTEYGKYLKGLDTLDITLSEFNYLLLTHHHDDHAGFAHQLLQDSRAKLIVHRNALPFLEKGTVDEAGTYVNWCIRMLTRICVTPPIVLVSLSWICRTPTMKVWASSTAGRFSSWRSGTWRRVGCW